MPSQKVVGGNEIGREWPSILTRSNLPEAHVTSYIPGSRPCHRGTQPRVTSSLQATDLRRHWPQTSLRTDNASPVMEANAREKLKPLSRASLPSMPAVHTQQPPSGSLRDDVVPCLVEPPDENRAGTRHGSSGHGPSGGRSRAAFGHEDGACSRLGEMMGP